MQNIIDQLLSGDGKMIAGVVLVLLAVFAPQLWERLKPYLPNFTKKSVAEDSLGIHASVQELIDYFHKEKDVEGVKIAARLGNHVYERRLAELLSEPE